MIGHSHGGHGHSHGAGPAGPGADGESGTIAAQPGSHRFRGRLAITFGLTAAFFVVELVVGLLSGSLALVADAGHMATDVLALGASLVATQIGLASAELNDEARQRWTDVVERFLELLRAA